MGNFVSFSCMTSGDRAMFVNVDRKKSTWKMGRGKRMSHNISALLLSSSSKSISFCQY